MPAIDLDPDYFKPQDPGFAVLVQPHADALGRIHDELLQGSRGFLGDDSVNAAQDLAVVDLDQDVIMGDAANEYGAIVTTPTRDALVASGYVDQQHEQTNRQIPQGDPRLGDTNVPPPPVPPTPPADAFPGTLSGPTGGLTFTPPTEPPPAPPAPAEPVEPPQPGAGAPGDGGSPAPAPVEIPSAPVNYVTHDQLAAVLSQLETQYVVMV